MKKFEAPVLEIVEDLKMEPVYASSGYVPDNPPPTPAGGDWDITPDWANHNSGSHSEVKIRGVHHGKTGGNTLTMNMVVVGFKLESVKDWGGMTVSNVTENGFTITRNNWFNPSDNFEFNIQITAKDSIYHGSVGKTGQPCPHRVICTSYISS